MIQQNNFNKKLFSSTGPFMDWKLQTDNFNVTILDRLKIMRVLLAKANTDNSTIYNISGKWTGLGHSIKKFKIFFLPSKKWNL